MAQFPSFNQIVWADWFANGSSTGGIQEAVDALAGGVGLVMLSPYKTYTITAAVWLHSGTTLMMNGATIIRATGSIADGHANNSGAVINVSPFGSNGTVPTSGTSQSNIAILGPGIIDGNQTNFTGLTNTSLGVFGVVSHFTDGFTVRGVKIQNVLQDGVRAVEGRNVQLESLIIDTVGQWDRVASCNGISLVNFANTSGWSERAQVRGITMKNIGLVQAKAGNNKAEAFISNEWDHLVVDGLTVDGCDFVLEFGGTHSRTTRGVAVTNVVAKNVREFFVSFNGSGGSNYRGYHLSHFDLEGSTDATGAHDGGVLYMAGSEYDLTDSTFEDWFVNNVNYKDTSTVNWIDIQSASGKLRERNAFRRITMIGKSGSTRTVDQAVTIRHSNADNLFEDVYAYEVPGIGFAVDDATAETQKRLKLTRVKMIGTNHEGFLIRNNAVAATISEIDLDECYAEDCARQTGNAGLKIEAAFAGSTISKVRVHRFRSKGGQAYGINLTRSDGTLDDVTVDGCDLDGNATAPMFKSGTMTNIRYLDDSVKGADVASAASIALPRGDAFSITGTTSIETVTPFVPVDQRILTLYLTTTITLKHNTGSSPKMKLRGDKDFNAVAGDSISFRYDGTDMIEVGRKMADPVEVVNIFDSTSTIWAPTIAGLPLTTSNSQMRMKMDFSRYKQARIVARGKLSVPLTGTISLKIRDVTNSVDITNVVTFSSGGTWATLDSTWLTMNSATVTPGDIEYEVFGTTTLDDLKDMELGAIQLQLRQV